MQIGKYSIYQLNIKSENIILEIVLPYMRNKAYKIAKIEYIPCGDKRFDYKILEKYFMYDLTDAELEELLEKFTEQEVGE